MAKSEPYEKAEMVVRFRDVAEKESPIFVRGISRSGGTLVTTVLDASSQLAMSYEIYPGLLVAGSFDTSSAEFGLSKSGRDSVSPGFILELSKLGREQSLRILQQIGAKPLWQFFLRAERGDLSFEEICSSFDVSEAGPEDDDPSKFGLEVVASIARKKMGKSKKLLWGAKCSGDFLSYARRWPRARFINVIRDPRDILASQLNTGSFRPDSVSLATSWRSNHLRFRNLVENKDIQGFELSYEGLCNNPVEEGENLFDFLGLSFEPSVLELGNKSLSIHRRPNGHLSLERVSQPIDSTKIGRWRKDLTISQAREIEDCLGDSLSSFVGERYL